MHSSKTTYQVLIKRCPNLCLCVFDAKHYVLRGRKCMFDGQSFDQTDFSVYVSLYDFSSLPPAPSLSSAFVINDVARFDKIIFGFSKRFLVISIEQCAKYCVRMGNMTIWNDLYISVSLHGWIWMNGIWARMPKRFHKCCMFFPVALHDFWFDSLSSISRHTQYPYYALHKDWAIAERVRKKEWGIA